MDNPNKHAADAASNKRSKHAHDGPTEEEEEKQPVVAAPAHASPIGRLCSDELGVLFNFLGLGELSRALAVSRSWSAFIRSSMPCARFKLACTVQSLAVMSSSVLARHISAIEHTSTASCKLTSDSLCILALAMPHIVSLDCALIPSAARKMILPAKLKTLELDVRALNAAGINRAVEAIGQLSALSHLTLVLPSWLRGVSFVPLSKCAALQMLTLKWMTPPSHTQLDPLRMLHHLRAVAVHLPGLLELNTFNCRDVSFLPAFSQLETLGLHIHCRPWSVTADATVEALSNCSQLTRLILCAPVTSKHLTTLLPHMPQLHTLSLFKCRELESLSFLSSVASLQRSLRTLQLNQCRHPALRTGEFQHLVSLAELSTLQLLGSGSEPLDESTQRLLTPPTSALPKLTEFECGLPL